MSNHHYPRRAVLRALLVAGGALCLPRLGYTEVSKVSKVRAQYQEQPKGEQNCANCAHFIAPDACKLVEGAINPNAWCIIWHKKQA